jgi:hypothetical protein
MGMTLADDPASGNGKWEIGEGPWRDGGCEERHRGDWFMCSIARVIMMQTDA